MEEHSLLQGNKFKDTIKLSYPMIISGLAIGLINIFDTAFLGRVSELALNVSNIGGIIYFMIIMVSNGLGMGVQVLMSRFAGQNVKSKLSAVFNNGLAFSFFISVLIVLLLYAILPQLLSFLLNRQDVVDGAMEYLKYRLWAIVPAYMVSIYRSMLNSINMNRILIWATFSMAVFNIILDYGLIFGRLCFDEMGVAGAGLASGLAELIGFGFVFIYTAKVVKRKFPDVHRIKSLNIVTLKSILKISNPLILQFLISNAIWLCFFIMITNAGERAGAISNLVKGLFMFYMIPAWGFVQAVNAITSNLIGQNRKDEVFKYALKSAGQIILLMLPFALGCLIFPRQILSLLTNNVELIDDAVNLIRMMSGFILFGSSCSLFYNAYAGTGDTKTAMFIEVSSALIYLAYVIYFIQYKWINVEVVWFSEYLYWIVIGFLSCIWLRKGKWKAMTL